jgi:hypothetical protein
VTGHHLRGAELTRPYAPPSTSPPGGSYPRYPTLRRCARPTQPARPRRPSFVGPARLRQPLANPIPTPTPPLPLTLILTQTRTRTCTRTRTQIQSTTRASGTAHPPGTVPTPRSSREECAFESLPRQPLHPFAIIPRYPCTLSLDILGSHPLCTPFSSHHMPSVKTRASPQPSSKVGLYLHTHTGTPI